MKPAEDEIAKVMQDTGMGYLQAYRHLQSRELARVADRKRRKEQSDDFQV